MVKTTRTGKTPSKTPTKSGIDYSEPSSISKFQAAALRALRRQRRETANGFGIGERFDLQTRNAQKATDDDTLLATNSYVPRKPRERSKREVTSVTLNFTPNKSKARRNSKTPRRKSSIKVLKTPITPQKFYDFVQKLTQDDEGNNSVEQLLKPSYQPTLDKADAVIKILSGHHDTAVHRAAPIELISQPAAIISEPAASITASI